jgi:methyltransferase (TIGR00027 family)
MNEKQSSRTAAGVALVRAIEARRPESQRICYDPYARAFVPAISVTISKWVVDAGIYERAAPGAMAFVTARERFFDDFLKAGLEKGLDQVVILGAGYDTRAYRIPGIEKTRVFEVDHPATQQVKLKQLKKVVDPLPAHVTFVPLDFNTQTLAERLPASGFSETGRTLFLWQGVTYFLTSQGVDSTLAFIANHSGPGSAVVFDYFYNEILRDTSRPDTKNLRRAAQVTGEAYMFGIDKGQVEAFMAKRGFRDIRDTPPKDLQRLYFGGPKNKRALAEGCAIVTARVGR